MPFNVINNIAEFKFQSDSINTIEILLIKINCTSFKFQSDSINTWGGWIPIQGDYDLNSNLILLIRRIFFSYSQQFIVFKFQSDSINTFIDYKIIKPVVKFKFQSDSINTIKTILIIAGVIVFKFQSDSINTGSPLKISSGYTYLNSNLILLIPVFKDTFKTTGYNTYFCRPKK